MLANCFISRVVPVLLLVVFVSGCLPRTIVRKNPGLRDRGVRYYRPKPYLRIAPQVDKDGTPSAQFVSIDLAYLPDFSEEYSISVKSGFGTNDTSITLDQGWNLTNLNVDIDSKTAENVEAVGSLLSDVSGLATKANTDLSGNTFVVAATNVPIGYYEAVLGQDCGAKHLYGFRYIGFLPYSPCPRVACGTPEALNCQTNSYDIFGLVFENGQMTFKNLGSLAGTQNGRLNRFEKVESLALSKERNVPADDSAGLVDSEALQVPSPE